MHCFLFIPDFFSSESVAPASRLAAAETLIARGRRKQAAPVAREAWLLERFGAARQRDWPVAPYTLLADGGSPGSEYWMRADPVNLSVRQDGLAFDGTALDLSRSEADALVAALNRHFGGVPAFDAPHPGRWYVKLPAAPELLTTPPAAARGVAIEDALPKGGDAMRFRALMNEAQMLLHEHPVNTGREARGVPPVNSLWFWGGGALATPAARPFSIVLAEDPLARGLALAAGIRVGTALAALPDEGKALIVVDAPRSPALERDWFGPLLAALQGGRIGMLSLYLAGEDSLLEVETVRSDLRCFWRTRKPLHSYLA
ncbi:MAG TPA: regulator [Burkholderiales bacterium]|nr:regulator [Burkholderiales bacterium]